MKAQSRKEKAKIIRALMDECGIGLPAAIDRYNYYSCYGELVLCMEDVRKMAEIYH